MTNEMRKMVQATIRLKLEEVQDFKYMGAKDAAEHDLLQAKYGDLEQELLKSFTPEQKKLYFEFETKASELAAFREDYFFNIGVKTGLWELSFIKEILGDSVIEL